MTALVEARAVAKHYPVKSGGVLRRRITPLRAVDSVDLTIEAGETLGLVGESGCGKSTLGRLLIRLLPITAGSVLFDAVDLATLSRAAMRETRRAMQIIFQDPYGALNPRMTVEDIIQEPLIIHGARAGRETRAEAARMLDVVGLPARALERFPHEFSGGQRQRIGIARALVLRPRFVVCDEPVSALDVSVQAQIVNLLRDLQTEFNLTYLFIAHDLAVVRHISDRVAVMYLGKVVEIAKKHSLYQNPLHPYTRALISAVPVNHPSHRPDRRTTRRGVAGDIPSPLNPPTGCRFHTRCPYVMPVCREIQPEVVYPEADRGVACHLFPAG